LRTITEDADIDLLDALHAALGRGEMAFRASAEAAPALVWAARADGYHNYFNPAWYAFTDADVGTTDGHESFSLIHPDDQAEAWIAWEESMRTGADFTTRLRLRHASGVYRPVVATARAVTDDAGMIRRWVGLYRVVDA
jgi:PAS domain-containing protein